MEGIYNLYKSFYIAPLHPARSLSLPGHELGNLRRIMTSRFSAEMSPARGLGLAGRALDGFDAPHDVPEGRPREKGCRDEARGVEHGDGGD